MNTKSELFFQTPTPNNRSTDHKPSQLLVNNTRQFDEFTSLASWLHSTRTKHMTIAVISEHSLTA